MITLYDWLTSHGSGIVLTVLGDIFILLMGAVITYMFCSWQEPYKLKYAKEITESNRRFFDAEFNQIASQINLKKLNKKLDLVSNYSFLTISVISVLLIAFTNGEICYLGLILFILNSIIYLTNLVARVYDLVTFKALAAKAAIWTKEHPEDNLTSLTSYLLSIEHLEKRTYNSNQDVLESNLSALRESLKQLKQLELNEVNIATIKQIINGDKFQNALIDARRISLDTSQTQISNYFIDLLRDAQVISATNPTDKTKVLKRYVEDISIMRSELIKLFKKLETADKIMRNKETLEKLQNSLVNDDPEGLDENEYSKWLLKHPRQ